MLQFILGRAGSGKTEQILQKIAQNICADTQPIWLLVPEQFSFESERTLLQRLGVRDAARVEVLSFRRLAQKVLTVGGGIATPLMDDVTRALLMHRALEIYAAPEQGNSRITSKTLHDNAYLSSLLTLGNECKQCAVSPQLLQATADGLEAGTLKNKLTDIAGIFNIYEGLAAGTGIDTEDLLHIACEKLPDSRLADGAHVYVDGFKGFTATELEILTVLMCRADVTMALCTDRLPTEETPAGSLFAPVDRSVQQLRRIATDHRVPMATPLILKENHRAATPALRALEAGCFMPRGEVYEEEADSVSVTPCPSIEEECAAVARRIRRIMRVDNVRAGEVAIIFRNRDDYSGILDRALKQENIPFYMDEASEMYTAPLVSLCLSAVRIAANGFQSEELLRMMKTGLLPFNELEIAQLENYVYMWRIGGARWERPFTANPAGLTEARHTDEALLERIEDIRRRLIAPLQTLKQQLSGGCDGKTFSTALYRYLTHPSVCADKGVRRLYEDLIADGEHTAADRTARLWDNMMDILHRFACVFAAEKLSAERYAELLHLAAGLIQLPAVPQSIDAVQVGSADHIRLQSPKVVCIMGANEGVFPAYPTDNALLTDRERSVLEQNGIRLSADRLQKAAEERFFAYTAIAAPSEQLHIFYCTVRNHEAALPSALVRTVDAILPRRKFEVCRAWDGSDIESAADAAQRLAAVYTADTQLGVNLKATLENNPDFRQYFDIVEKGAHKPQYSLSPDTAANLFGQHMALSASQADTFFRCKFRYFCQYGMRLNTRRIADVDASMFGTFAHYVMEKLLPVYAARDHAPAPADIPQMLEHIHTVLFAYVEEEMGGFADKPARFRYLLSLVERTCFSLLWFTVNELASGRFCPADYELSIGKDGIPSPVIPLANGGSVRIIGKIDRVDTYKRDDTVFIRVVDYKTGSKEFKLSEIPYGINMQMLLYLFAVCDSGAARYESEKSSPAGVLYLPARDITLKNTHAPLDESRLSLMRMNGLLLRDADVLTAMETDGNGTYIPATVQDGVIGKSDSIASKKDFANIRALTERLLVEMANHLLEGTVAAVPTGDTGHLPCTYCDFRSICRHEEQDESIYMQSQKNAAVLTTLEEGCTNGGE